ncbi:MAG: glycoside hydrolase family 15 protein [Rhodoglobus sp.]
MTTVKRELSVSDLADIAANSARLIRKFQDASGAYPASPTFSAYRGYSWFRDGAFIADGMSAHGEAESASRFHDWCSGILVSRRDQITRIVSASLAGSPVPDVEMLPTRFTLAGGEGADDWWDFQLDGYGTWAWAVVQHARRHSLSLDPWREALELATDYLLSSWQRPCFDWWEEHAEHVHVSTLGCISAGLRAASHELDADRAARALAVVAEIDDVIRQRGVVDGFLTKWLGSSEVDASVLCLVHPLAVFPPSDALGAATTARIDEQLNVGGGVHRYLADTFFGGGQWPLLSCMLGLALSAGGERDRALDQLRWAASTITPAGDMPEQVGEHLLFPEREQEWIDRWGTVATPLLWSHGMYLRLAAELGVNR